MRDFFAGLFFLLAAVLGAAALTGAVLAQEVGDPDRPGRVLASVLDQPAARDVVAEQIADRVARERPELSRDRVEAVTRQVLGDPRFRDVLASVPAEELGGSDSGVPDAIADELAERGQDELADLVRSQSGIVPADSLDGLVEAMERARTVLWVATAVAGLGAAVLALFGYASGSTPARRWIGLGIAVMLAGVLAGLLLSGAAGLVGEESPPLAVLLASLATEAAPSARTLVLACLLVGGVLLLGGAVAGARGSRR